MASKIDQLISALAGALRDFDAGNGSMPREEIADALALANAADDEHRAQMRALRADVEAAKGQAEHEAEHRGWLRGNDWNARERDNAIRLRDEMCGERDEARADAERVRRGARCLRERCRRLESRARGAEERADITRTAALYAWRMLYEVEFPPFERGAWMRELYGRVATRYGAPFAAAGREARAMIDVLGLWRGEEW